MGRMLVGAIELPGGVRVRGRGLRRGVPEGTSPDFGLYLGSGKLRRKYDGGLSWEREWIQWPDFLLPRDRNAARQSILGLHARALAGEDVEVACYGGSGRTGTVLSCLTTLSGLSGDEAITWVREHYTKHAVETPWQRRWVDWFARQPS
ncbi:protein tyrosine phosphatase [Amycolatopsis sp. NPDC058986]|uniref:protein-tyrosine phosphatase family protein n=1 Tax=unclassified Amycolatopsis TaxID=2618356 RepID=UPI00366D6DCE